MSKTGIEELPFAQFLEVLRTNGLNEDAELIEKQIREIADELGWTKEQLDTTPHKDVLDVMRVYKEALQSQLDLHRGAGMTLYGRWMAGKGISDDTIRQVIQIQSQRMEKEKARLGIMG